MEPVSRPIDGLVVALLGSSLSRYSPGGLFIAGFFDGHMRPIMPDDLDPEVCKGLVTPDGGEPVGLD